MQSCNQNSWGKPHSHPVGTPLELTYNAETRTLKLTRDSLPALTTPFSVIPGTAGKDGKNGVDGKDGINGTNGTNGVNGTNGINGIDGAKGDKGDPGIIDITNPVAVSELMTAMSANPDAITINDAFGSPIFVGLPA